MAELNVIREPCAVTAAALKNALAAILPDAINA